MAGGRVIQIPPLFPAVGPQTLTCTSQPWLLQGRTSGTSCPRPAMIYRANTQQCWERQQFQLAMKEGKRKTNRQTPPDGQNTQPFGINASVAALSQPRTPGSLRGAPRSPWQVKAVGSA